MPPKETGSNMKSDKVGQGKQRTMVTGENGPKLGWGRCEIAASKHGKREINAGVLI